MNMMILGNCISLVASICLAASCCAKSKESAYRLQAAESGVLCVSYLVFNALAGDPQMKLKLLKFALGRGYEYDTVRPLVEQVIRSSAGVSDDND